MADLIDRDKLLAAYDAAHKGPPGGAARKLIHDAPAIDAVEIVRCKDCASYDNQYCPKGCGWCNEAGIERMVNDNFYCGYAERVEKDG